MLLLLLLLLLMIIVKASGTILKSFRKYLSNILGKHKVKELQKTAILGTAHILCKLLTYKHKTFSIGNYTTCTINCNCCITAVLYTLETLFVFGE
jgi:hypothetical protein